MSEIANDLFPEFTKFASETGLVDKAKGILAAKVPRILGQGRTKSIGIDVAPAEIERKLELVSLRRAEIDLPRRVLDELFQAEAEIDRLRKQLMSSDGSRKFAVTVLRAIGEAAGIKDNRYHAGGLILSHDKAGFEWSWSITPHYPIIKRLPPDASFIVKAYENAKEQINQYASSENVFEDRLKLSWTIARHFAASDDVYVTDVMRVFHVAAQSERFWQMPKRQNFIDLPEAAFVLSYMASKKFGSSSMAGLEFVPATLHQAHGKNAKVFYLPMNPEGTDVRPMVYLRPRTNKEEQH